MNQSLVKAPSAEQWAGQICAQLSKSAEAIIATGRLLVKAKADLPHGEWGRMFQERLIPLSQDVATMFMRISEHPQLANSEHVRNLPPSYATLYELTKVPDEALHNAFRDGLITPSMERKEVKALLPRATEPSRPRKSHPSPRASTYYQALDEARDCLIRWGHISAFAPVCDAITALLEYAQKGASS